MRQDVDRRVFLLDGSVHMMIIAAGEAGFARDGFSVCHLA